MLSDAQRTRQLVLVGATGYTGGLVAERLVERGLPFVATGRDESALERVAGALPGAPPGAVSTRRVDLADARDLAWLARPEHVVLSCAGPFNLIGRGLATAVADGGAAYLDVTGEEPFVGFLMGELDGRARATGALLVPSCAFESLPADVLVSSLLEAGETALEIASYYRVSDHALSPGTLLTMKLASHWRTSAYEAGAFVERAPGSLRRELELPFLDGAEVGVFAPYPEIRFWPRRYATSAALSFLAVSRGEAALLGRRSGARERAVADVVARHRRRQRSGPTAEERARQGFGVGVVVTRADGRVDAAHLTGTDPYGLTAEVAAAVAESLLRGEAEGRAGVRAPGELFAPTRMLDVLRAWSPDVVHGRTSLRG